MLKTLASGADGVLILACEKQACKFFEGSARASKRFEYARLWLDEIGIEGSRISFVHATPRNDEQMERILDEFEAGLAPLGGAGVMAGATGV
jgi:coenzyme F420-reducing hydrogenase delta subunit